MSTTCDMKNMWVHGDGHFSAVLTHVSFLFILSIQLLFYVIFIDFGILGF